MACRWSSWPTPLCASCPTATVAGTGLADWICGWSIAPGCSRKPAATAWSWSTTVWSSAARAFIWSLERRLGGQSRAQGLDYRRRLRPHPAPEEKRFRRLFDQHAQAVDGFGGAMLGRPAQEGSRFVAVEHVIANRALDAGGRQGRDLAAQAGRGAVDDDLRPQGACCGEIDGSQRHRAAKALDQLLGTAQGAVGDDDLGRPLLQQRRQQATHGAASAEHQHAASGKRRPVVVAQVPY